MPEPTVLSQAALTDGPLAERSVEGVLSRQLTREAEPLDALAEDDSLAARLERSFNDAAIRGALAVLLIGQSLPRTGPEMERAIRELEQGFIEGALDGFVAAFESTVSTYAWLRDALFTMLAAPLDEHFGRELGKRLMEDLANGVDPLEGPAAAYAQERYPAMLDIARGCATIIRLRDPLERAATSLEENGVLGTLTRIGVLLPDLLKLLAVDETTDALTELAKRRGQPREQGKYVGEPVGAVTFELAAEALTAAVKPLTAPKWGRRAIGAAKAATAVFDKASSLTLKVDGLFSIKLARRSGWSLYAAVAEAANDLATPRVISHRALNKQTGGFNRFYKELRVRSGWGSQLTLHSHHVIEARMFKALRNQTGFREAFDKLGWESPDDMFAIPIFDELHIRSYESLSNEFKMRTPVDKERVFLTPSLTAALKGELKPHQFTDFREMLEAYRAFYKKTEFRGEDGRMLKLEFALWSKVEPAFAEIDRILAGQIADGRRRSADRAGPPDKGGRSVTTDSQPDTPVLDMEPGEEFAEDEPTGGSQILGDVAQRTTNDLQQRLKDIGWPINVDGVHGSRTFGAVKEFQRGFAWWSLVVDGYAGPKTWEALDTAKANDGRCSPNFRFREFKSRGDGWIKVACELVLGLEEYREVLGGPVRIVSGYRDPAWNHQNGGAQNSQHLFGNACDLDPALTLASVRGLKCFSGIGTQRQTGKVRHIDVRHMGPNTTGGTPTRPTLWYYG